MLWLYYFRLQVPPPSSVQNPGWISSTGLYYPMQGLSWSMIGILELTKRCFRIFNTNSNHRSLDQDINFMVYMDLCLCTDFHGIRIPGIQHSWNQRVSTSNQDELLSQLRELKVQRWERGVGSPESKSCVGNKETMCSWGYEQTNRIYLVYE
jgi:hypothetical protein